MVACRETDVVADWLTDGNFAMHSGPTGLSGSRRFPEHLCVVRQAAGHSIGDLDAWSHGQHGALRRHSLGGALATLAAAHCHQRGIGRPELYTFASHASVVGACCLGSDRPSGQQSHPSAFHFADPVPMVPLWPFMHVPYGGAGNAIGGNRTSLISFGAHSMEHSYLQAVSGLGWNNLSATTNNRTAGQMAEAWLKDVANGREAIVLMGARSTFGLRYRAGWLVDQSLDLFVWR